MHQHATWAGNRLDQTSLYCLLLLYLVLSLRERERERKKRKEQNKVTRWAQSSES
jgi:hypothetical protein